MAQFHLLDRLMGAQRPDLSTDALLRAFEATPYDERIAAQSTYEALQLGAARDPEAPALHFLPNADPGEAPLTLSYRQFMAGVTQAANMFHALGVGPNDVVSFLLPLLPREFHVAVRRPGRRHRQPGQSAARAGADRRDSARRQYARCW